MTSDYASTWVNNIHPVLIVESTSDGPIHSPDIDVRTSDYASIWVNNIHPVLIVESTSDGPIHSPDIDVRTSDYASIWVNKIHPVLIVESTSDGPIHSPNKDVLHSAKWLCRSIKNYFGGNSGHRVKDLHVRTYTVRFTRHWLST